MEILCLLLEFIQSFMVRSNLDLILLSPPEIPSIFIITNRVKAKVIDLSVELIKHDGE